MSKLYRVTQDIPAWHKGAILSNEDDDDKYQAINDLWDTEACDKVGNYYEVKAIIENAPDFFERVYKVNILKKAQYLNKERARAAHEKLHQP